MRSCTICAYFVCFNLALAQQAPDKPAFEVASIKASDPNPSNPTFIGMSADGAMVKYTNISLRDSIRGACRVRDFQIVGPGWMASERFEINARLPAGASTDQIPEMLGALLVERFKLEIRREIKELNVYALVVGNGGAKLKPAEIKTDNNSPKALGPDGKPRDLMMFMTPPGGVPGPDRPDGATTSAEPAPSVFDAVKQYGLRMEARRAPIETITVTHLEKTATEN